MIRNNDVNRRIRFIGNENLHAALVLLFFLVLFYRDVVFYGRTFLMETAAPGTMPEAGPYNYTGTKPGFVANDPGAIAWAMEPLNRLISKLIKHGDFPLWNPYGGLAGGPLLADGHTGPLEPLQLLLFFVPNRYWPYTVDVQLLIRFFLAGFFCYLFARRLKIDFLGGISAGVLFMLSSYFVTFGNHPQIKTEMLLPLVLYGYDRLADVRDKLGVWFCALFIGWAIIAAMPEATFFVLFLGTLWYFYKSIMHRAETGMAFSEVKAISFRYLGSTMLGFLISAAYLLPFLEFVSLAKSVHSPGTGGDALPLWALPNLIFQVPGSFHLQLGFFAIFSLFYSLLHLKYWPLEYRKNLVFFSLYAIIFMLMIFDFPLTNWIRALPVFNQLVLKKYSIPSIVFCLTILVGILIDRIIHTPLSYKELLLSLLTIFVLFIGLPTLGNPTKSLSAYFIDKISMSAAFGLIFGILITLVLLAFLHKRQKISSHVMQLCLLFPVIVEPFFWSTNINRPDRVDPFQSPPFVDYLRDDKELFRVFGMDGILYPNISTAYQLADIRWLNALVPKRTYDFSAHFVESKEVNSIRFTGTILPISDRMFNLLNVKYILDEGPKTKRVDKCLQKINAQPYFGTNTINKLVFEQNPEKKNALLEAPLNINGITRTTILAQSPQEFSVKLIVPKNSSTLYFSIGLNPEVFLPDRGDGVDYRITLSENKYKYDVFSKYIDPKNNPCERRWLDESVNLDQWAGKEIILSFSTSPGPKGDISWDWAYWGDIHLATSSYSKTREASESLQQYELVYQNQGVRIYQNENVFPRAFVVYNILNIHDFDEALGLLAAPELDLRQTAVIEKLPIELEKLINANNQQVKSVAGNVKQIDSGELMVIVNTKKAGLLILTDQYYPGWTAYVNGEPTTIYAVNGIFRGIFLDKGEHIIEFKYQPLSFIIGGVLSVLSLLIVFVSVLINHNNFIVKNKKALP